ncbi:RHS repeat-associated core domain-containing protein [Amycolatopsis sp. cmx-4-68]|uniref:RHS repeat-associated core domain-containing protein n=1 Tax=Amycolatopsis sp. cmx-4-68 TaxID=2790938 RepID=UPI0039793E38
MSSPLVAKPQSQTTAVTGIGIAESATDLANGVKDGSWVEFGMGALGVGMEVLSLVIDPIGTLAQYGVSWLIEHVRPLKEALDWLAGNPPVIQSFADTWANVAGEVGAVAGDLANEAKTGTAGWTGEGADAYRAHAAEQCDAIAGAGTLADGISTGVMIMGQVVAMVRETVRDLVAELVGKLISWALEEACTLGFATPAVAVQATTAITNAIHKVSDLIRKLVKTVGNAAPKLRKIVDKLGEILEKLSKLGRQAGRRADGVTPSHAGSHTGAPHLAEGTTPAHAHTPDGPEVPAGSHAPDGTSPSGTTPSSSRIKDHAGEPRDNAVPADKLRCEQDPVDVVSGRMIMAQTDVELLGVLAVTVRRVHVSSYRVGRCFGPSWASTLDQRLELEADGVYLAADDGTLQVFPHPAPGHPATAEEGPRRTLERAEDGGYRLTDFERRHVLHFGPGDAVCPISAITDRNGNRIDFRYADSGAPAEIRHSSGYRIRVECDGTLVTALYLAGADGGELPLTRYRYRDARLAEVVDASGSALRFDYDPAGRVTGWTDRNGGWYRYSYDAAGRVVRTEGPGGAMSGTLEYDSADRVTHSIDSLGGRTTFRFNEAQQVVGEVDPLGHETRFEWDRFDRLLSRTDAVGRTDRYRYDERGDLVAVTRPDGSQFLFEYDDFHLPVTVIGPDGATTRREYDDRGNVTKVTDPAGGVTELAYDERGGLVRVTDPLGYSRRLTNDAFGLPASSTDPLGAVVRYARDRFGRLVAITDPNGGVTRFGWTVGGGLAWRSLPDGSREEWGYDGEGNCRVHTDPLGQVTRTEYTAFDLPSAERRPDGTSLEFTYDTALRLTGVRNELGLHWQRQYDAAGHLVRETDFDGRTLTYRYDPAGRLVERVNGAGESMQFGYDLLGNVVERRTASGVTTFAHDPAGRLVHASDGTTELSFTHDALGRVVEEAGNGRTVVSRYDALGRRTGRRLPSGAEATWEYDPNDQPLALHTAGRTVRFRYDPAGRELQRLIGPDVVLAQRWNANSQLVSQTIAGPAGRLQDRSYTYRADGLLTGIDDRLTGRRSFELDAAGRVTAVAGPGRRETYRYDAAGNLTGASWPDSPAELDVQGERRYRGTRPHSAGQTRYEHDAQGRVVLRQRKRLSRKPDTWRYAWDAEDHLVEVRTPDGTRWRYRYDPLGRRIAKQRFGADDHVVEQIDFVWDGIVLAEQVRRVAGSADHRLTGWEYEPNRFTPVVQREGSWRAERPQEWYDERFYAIVTDFAGAPTELVTERGAIAWHERTSLWGRTIAGSGPAGATTPLRFPGQYADPETGFNYNHHRHYDPDTGRYASADPLGLAAGSNHYRYVANPLMAIDPLGLVSCTLNAYADGLRGPNQSSTPRVASEYTTPSGRPYHGHNREGVPIPDHLRNEMEQIAPLSNRHGACAEVNALSNAYHGERAAALAAGKTAEEADALARQAIRGGSMESVRVRPTGSPANSHGTPIDPCPPYCTPLLARLGISWPGGP